MGQMEFNQNKCKVLHFGKLCKDGSYAINGWGLENTVEQRGLVVQVHISLKVALHVDKVVKKACLPILGKVSSA